jgi:hypothetical protein
VQQRDRISSIEDDQCCNLMPVNGERYRNGQGESGCGPFHYRTGVGRGSAHDPQQLVPAFFLAACVSPLRPMDLNEQAKLR